jgi:CxxC-x17-CxxC domain-containing protein
VPEERLMEYQDKNMVCADCRQSFVWTAGEQHFYAEKGFGTPPKRCKDCKAKRASERDHGGRPSDGSGARVQTVVKCSQCGKETTVPFKPSGDKPVYCKECFAQRRR